MTATAMRRSIVLSGFAGTGKSTIGAALAARLRVPFVDTDQAITRRAGKSIDAIWRDDGEGTFRDIEREVVIAALAEPPCVIACGGGALAARAVRFAALDAATVVTLRASVDCIVERTRARTDRPLLRGSDVATRVRDLLDARADAYAECHRTLDTSTIGIDDAVRALEGSAHDRSIVVPLKQRSHLFHCVDDSPEALDAAIAQRSPTSTLVVTDANVARHRAGALARLGRFVTLEPGEEHKTLGAVSRIWEEGLASLDRDGLVIAFGGGVVGDLAGFAAATALRGVRWLQAPTTLLSMVDASIGGKTGFDVASGKNRVGAMHQPSAIVADVAHLATLPEREVRAGMAEVVKIAVACDPLLFAALEAQDAVLPKDAVSIVLQSAAAKIRIVREDENERAGLRAVLNLGHTVGHALEAEGKYRTHLHGEAVAIGLVDELAASTRLGVTPPGVMTRVKVLLAKLGLPTDADDALRTSALDRLGADKKRFGETIELPLVTGIGTSRVERVPLTTFRSALA